jgi:16S rRNA (cytosine1402-N4)-methyltransferase
MPRHEPVLLKEVLTSLNLKKGSHVIDCTLGDGGHAEEALKTIGPRGKLLGIDVDPESLLRAKQYLYTWQNQVTFVRESFGELSQIVADVDFGPANAIVMDLGWSSPQFSERNRGFSFDSDEPLDMRFNPGSENKTASDLVNELDWEDLYRIFRRYGEEDLSKEVAEAIIEFRKNKKIERSKELAEIVLQVYRTKLRSAKEVPWIGGLHPATKVFQALRIAVNHELEVLEKALPQAIAALAPGGRLAVISFHSLEDRIVKHYFQSQENKTISIITKKPIVAGGEEVAANRRSESAKLRVVEKL